MPIWTCHKIFHRYRFPPPSFRAFSHAIPAYSSSPLPCSLLDLLDISFVDIKSNVIFLNPNRPKHDVFKEQPNLAYLLGEEGTFFPIISWSQSRSLQGPFPVCISFHILHNSNGNTPWPSNQTTIPKPMWNGFEDVKGPCVICHPHWVQILHAKSKVTLPYATRTKWTPLPSCFL